MNLQQMLDAVNENIVSLTKIEQQDINQYPEEYTTIILAAIEKDPAALQYVNQTHIQKNPGEFQRLALLALKKDPLSLRYIDQDYITAHPVAYQMLILMAVKNQKNALAIVNKNYIAQHHKDYKAIILDIIKEAGIELFRLQALNNSNLPRRRSLLSNIGNLQRTILDTVALIDPMYIKNHPNEYQAIALETVRKSATVLQGIDKNYIAEHPKEYHELILAAMESGKTILAYIDKQYIANHPKEYQALVLTMIEKHYTALHSVDLDYITKHPDNYQEMILKAIEKGFKDGLLNYILQKEYYPHLQLKVNQVYITQYPTDYQKLMIKAIEHNASAVFVVDPIYSANYPEQYKTLILKAIKQQPDLFPKLNVDQQTMILEETINQDPTKNNILKSLKNIAAKSDELRKRNYYTYEEHNLYSNHYLPAKTLYANISIALIRYCDNQITSDEFKKTCTTHIQEARPILEQHRDWKKILFNLALAIAGVGVVYLVAGLINLGLTKGKHFFFTIDTDSAKRINVLEQAINEPVPELPNGYVQIP
jgi:hypothetical protein